VGSEMCIRDRIYSILQSILNIGDIANLHKSVTDNPALKAIGSAIQQAVSDGVVKNALKAKELVDSSNALENASAGVDAIFNNKFTNSVAKFRDDFISAIPSNLRQDLIDPHAIDPYERLYLTELTNVTYLLPYFDTQYVNIRNTFIDAFKRGSNSDSSNSSYNDSMPFNSLTKFIDTGLNKILDVASALEPGVYIERPQFYNFSNANAPEVTIRFPLLNTLNIDSIQKNLEFIQKLTLQNKQYKKSRVLSEQPVIYQVTIPGQAYYPYAYIERMNVNFLGTKRVRKVKYGAVSYTHLTLPTM
jgi:hypothetical protein